VRDGTTTTLSRVVRAVALIRPVHKSPSLTVTECWLPTAISTVKFVVTTTMCFQPQGGRGGHPDHPDRLVVGMVRVDEVRRRGGVGLMQINVAVPAGTPVGAVPLQVAINGNSTQTVNVTVR